MKYSYQISLFVLLAFAVTNSYSQTQQLKFSLITGTSGISLGKINCIIQDKHGFAWLSDQSNRCIIRYDGTRMTRFQYDPKNPNSPGGYYPECLATDTAGNIWIGYYGMGLDKFNPVTKTFTHYRHKKNDSTSLADDFVAAIAIDHAGDIWVGTYAGLDKLDTTTGTFKHFANRPGDANSLSCNKVRAIYEDHQHNIWVGTGFPWDPDNTGGLNLLNRTNGKFTQYLSDPKDPTGLASNKVRAIFEDSRGTFWIGTMGDGLHTMDRKTGIITRLPYDSTKPGNLSRPPLGTYDDHITFITEDAASQIWIGTMTNGLVRYNPVTKEIVRYGTANTESGPYNDNTSWWACPTADGLIWFSTQAAKLYQVDLYNNVIPHTGHNNNDGTFSFLQESDSIFWYGTNTGLIRKNLLTGTITRLAHDHHNPGTLSNSMVEGIVKDKRGDLWLATDNGLNHYAATTKKLPGIYTMANRVYLLDCIV